MRKLREEFGPWLWNQNRFSLQNQENLGTFKYLSTQIVGHGLASSASPDSLLKMQSLRFFILTRFLDDLNAP